MFVRVDRDLVVNMNQITSYNIIEEPDAYKLVLYKNDKMPLHTVYYMKEHGHQVEILISFINVMNEVILNPENVKPVIIPQEETQEPKEDGEEIFE